MPLPHCRIAWWLSGIVVELSRVTFHGAIVPQPIGPASAPFKSARPAELLWTAHALNHVPRSWWDVVKAIKWTFPIRFSSSVFLFYPILNFHSSQRPHQNPSHKHRLGGSSGQQVEPCALIAASMGASIKGPHLDSWWFSGSWLGKNGPELMLYCLRGGSRSQLR